MESSEAAKIVHDRIKQFEPHAASKIFGSIYWQHQNPDQEMIRLAFGPDNLIRSVIQKAKTALVLHSSPIISASISHPYFPNEDHNFDQSCSFQNQYGDMSIRGRRNSPNVTDYNSVKSCHYFSRGFCKHGSNCRYFHGESASFPASRVFGYDDDRVLYSEKLEMEVVELLRSRKGQPISIASLPMMYFEKYGKTLQAEGYLTESQRHGKAGYNLTKLLAQLKNIRLIDRPHGQHAVMLAEDAIWGDRYEHSQTFNGSRQIYMTFLANSTFTEEEVSNYFSMFGPVQDVRIPFQKNRMFGFVTFVSADTVKLILSQGNPHYIGVDRVLVKPYREKSKLAERKYPKRFGPPMYYYSHPISINSELQSRFSDRLLMENYDNALEVERRHLSQLQLTPKALASQSCLGYANCSDQESVQGLNLPNSPFASAVV